jgi:putative ubiquitin-RnfH superfamily antitoxin RatB of RatAB toxin-antitoxin module
VLGEEVELGRVEVVVRDVFRDPKEVRRRRSQRLALC